MVLFSTVTFILPISVLIYNILVHKILQPCHGENLVMDPKIIFELCFYWRSAENNYT